ncbi:transcription factor IIIA-like [Leptopilina boulardi]|uniref:transcription factor IIIA-like n=1 Tax=Leptopilina boulardi TaxID=63433 RepID=UPI0021F5868A|nr:transcription factor IIIA-like [Leptopilina boulardi]XP_051159706.1 transcription factor IIIA-like [Leptopilina boulardi]
MSKISSVNLVENANDNNSLLKMTKFEIEFVNVKTLQHNNYCVKDERIKFKSEFIEKDNYVGDISCCPDEIEKNLETLLVNVINEKDNLPANEREIEFINVKNINRDHIHLEDEHKSKVAEKKKDADSNSEIANNSILVKEENIDDENKSDEIIEIDTVKKEINKVFFEEHIEPKRINKKIRRTNKEKKFRCTYPGCKIKFVKPSKLKRHICMHTGERPFACNFNDCDKAYTNNSYLIRHKLTHGDMKEKFLCSYCKTAFSSPQSLKRHCSSVHEDPLKLHHFKRKCTECHFTCLTRKILSKHMMESHKRNLYQCSFCPKSFTEPSSLHRHLKSNMHKTFTCKICFQSFDKHVEFREHKKEHIVVYKEFTCGICGLKFNHKGNLRLHLQGHESSNIFVCSYDGCNRVYCFQRNLDTHILSYHLGKKWECHLCPMKLSSKQKLNGHIEKIHLNPVPRKPQPTKENRKRRRDIGIPRKSAISQICGILLPPETEKIIIYRHDIKCEQP